MWLNKNIEKDIQRRFIKESVLVVLYLDKENESEYVILYNR